MSIHSVWSVNRAVVLIFVLFYLVKCWSHWLVKCYLWLEFQYFLSFYDFLYWNRLGKFISVGWFLFKYSVRYLFLAMVCLIWLCYYFTHKELCNKIFLCFYVFELMWKIIFLPIPMSKARNNVIRNSQILKWINPIFVLMLFFIFFFHMKFDRYNNGRIKVQGHRQQNYQIAKFVAGKVLKVHVLREIIENFICYVF